jgi:Zn-dependent oligopeptidase
VLNSATGRAFRERFWRGGSQEPMVLFVDFRGPCEASTPCGTSA